MSGAAAREQWEDAQPFDFSFYFNAPEEASANAQAQQEAPTETSTKGPERYKKNLFGEPEPGQDDSFRGKPR